MRWRLLTGLMLMIQYIFENLSVYKKERNGYLYPRSEMAASVALALTGKIQALDIPVF